MLGWVIIFVLCSLIAEQIVSNMLDKYEAGQEPVWLIAAYFFIAAFIFILLIYMLVV